MKSDIYKGVHILYGRIKEGLFGWDIGDYARGSIVMRGDFEHDDLYFADAEEKALIEAAKAVDGLRVLSPKVYRQISTDK